MPVTRADFECPCCAANHINNAVVSLVQTIETQLGSAVNVNSGYRCAAHNRTVGGAPNSQHLRGNAADITSRDAARRNALFNICLRMWNNNQIGGLGIYNTFRHVDTGRHRTWRG